jgi:hypothetical protein
LTYVIGTTVALSSGRGRCHRAGSITLQLVRPDITQSCILLAAVRSCANHTPTASRTTAMMSPAMAPRRLSPPSGSLIVCNGRLQKCWARFYHADLAVQPSPLRARCILARTLRYGPSALATTDPATGRPNERLGTLPFRAERRARYRLWMRQREPEQSCRASQRHSGGDKRELPDRPPYAGHFPVLSAELRGP